MTPPDLRASARDAARGVIESVTQVTPGQRWTVGLMLGLAAAVLAFGLPSATRTLLPTPSGAAAVDRSSDERALPGPELPSDPIVLPQPDPPPATVPPTEPEVVPPGATDEATDLEVVALVDPTFGIGDRSDEAMAKRFLATAGLHAAIVPISDPETTCGAARGAALAIAGGPLPAAIGDCLHAAGTLTLSFDDDGRLGPVDAAVSSRRGAVRSLLDTADRLALQLRGRLGLVADERLKRVLEPVLPVARSLGLDLASITWLPAGPPPPAIALDLAGQRLAGVLFATSTQNQSVIGSQLRTIVPGTRLVVLDAADSIVDASYAPLVDGAMAVTSVQLPWHPGAAAQRAACRATWETAQTPPVILDGAELLRALTWCQHAAMAEAASHRLDRGVRAAVTTQAVTSPITSQLTALADGGFGPGFLTVATWSASCACWRSSDPFTPGASGG